MITLNSLHNYISKKRRTHSNVQLKKHQFKDMFIDFPEAPYHGVQIKYLVKYHKPTQSLKVKTITDANLYISPNVNLSKTPPSTPYDPSKQTEPPLNYAEKVFREKKLHYLIPLKNPIGLYFNGPSYINGKVLLSSVNLNNQTSGLLPKMGNLYTTSLEAIE